MRPCSVLLERFGCDLEPDVDQHGAEDDKKTLQFQNVLKTVGFCMFFEGLEGVIRGIFGVFLAVLRTSWRSLGRSGGFLRRSRGRLGRVLGLLGVLGNVEKRLTMAACV